MPTVPIHHTIPATGHPFSSVPPYYWYIFTLIPCFDTFCFCLFERLSYKFAYSTGVSLEIRHTDIIRHSPGQSSTDGNHRGSVRADENGGLPFGLYFRILGIHSGDQAVQSIRTTVMQLGNCFSGSRRYYAGLVMRTVRRKQAMKDRRGRG